MPSYDYQIRLLETRLKQLEQGTDEKDLKEMTQIINDLRRLRRLKWEEEHERVGYDDER
jgi:hypothetical protein